MAFFSYTMKSLIATLVKKYSLMEENLRYIKQLLVVANKLLVSNETFQHRL
jgi:hypothetical protein